MHTCKQKGSQAKLELELELELEPSPGTSLSLMGRFSPKMRRVTVPAQTWCAALRKLVVWVAIRFSFQSVDLFFLAPAKLNIALILSDLGSFESTNECVRGSAPSSTKAFTASLPSLG